MKLLRYGEWGKEKPGLLDAAGQIRDLSHYCADLSPYTLSDASFWRQLNGLDVQQLPLVDSEVRIGACVANPGKVVCVGLNSVLHTQQLGHAVLERKELLLFLKATSAVCGPYDPIFYMPHMKKLDWEAELGLVIGKQGKYIKACDAHEYILGYTCVNDLSERYWQFETQDKQFTKGKSFDHAAPIGPFLVTRDEVLDANNLVIKLWVNDQLRQDFNTSDYIHADTDVVSYVSQFFTLYPGDVISMGSGPGNAIAWGEDAYLKPNDEVRLEIAGLGQQKQRVMLEHLA